MGSKRRGRERLETCVSCGRSVPRDKAVDFIQKSFFTTDLRSSENVSMTTDREVFYCISCAKHRKIFEKKKRMMQRRREGGGY